MVEWGVEVYVSVLLNLGCVVCVGDGGQEGRSLDRYASTEEEGCRMSSRVVLHVVIVWIPSLVGQMTKREFEVCCWRRR